MDQRRRQSGFVMAFLIAALVFSACGADDSAGTGATGGFKAAIVLTTTGLGDKSFNDSAKAGLDRAQKELGVQTQVLETTQPSDYEPNLIQSPSYGNDITFAIGFPMTDALTRVSTERPDEQYGIVDSVVDQPNVASLIFKEEEGSFLVGVIAGMTSKSNKVGFIGGIEVPLIKRFEVGYAAGVKSVNPNAQVVVTYAGSFNDPAKGKEIVLSQYAQGADVIYHAAGGTGLGLFQAAKEKGPGFWAIGVDADQYDLAPENTLTSMVKYVDVAVFQTIQAAKQGQFKGGIHTFGLKEGGVGLSLSTEKTATKESVERAKQFRQMIIDGKFKVPATPEELQSFTPPQ